MIDWFMEYIFIPGLILICLGLLGFLGYKIYDDATSDAFELIKKEWTCTSSHQDLITTTTTVNNVPMIQTHYITVCDQYTRRD